MLNPPSINKSIEVFRVYSDKIIYVVGATKSDFLKKIRDIIPDNFLLIPGVGAQGGDVDEVIKSCTTTENKKILINISRSIIYAGNDENFVLEVKENQGEGKVYLDPNNPLTGVRTEGAYKYREDQVRPLLENAFEVDEEIMRLTDLIKTGTVGTLKEGDEGYDDGLKALHARLNVALQEQGIVPLSLIHI